MRKTKGKFKHLTYTDRLKIETLLNAKCSIAYIACELHCTRQTVYNEIARGSYMHLNTNLTKTRRYSCDLGQSVRDHNQCEKGPGLKIGNDKEFADFVEHMIVDKKYSPAAVLMYIKNNSLKFDTSICRTTLYSYIDKQIFLRLSNKELPVKSRRKKKYKKLKRIKHAPAGQSIEKRPFNNDERKFGDWEMDTVKGRKKKTKGCLFVLTERLTRKEIVLKLKNQKASAVVDALDAIKRTWKENFSRVFKSITCDNGVEFSDYKNMRQNQDGTLTDIYYCHPYSSYERGSNENNNKLIRRHIPKGDDIDNYTDADIKQLENWINSYPRKIFGGKSSQEMFDIELKKLGIFMS